MSPSEADQRIFLSRHTLSRYVQMLDTGQAPVSDMQLFSDEASVLTGIAVEHPGKSDKLVRLIAAWNDFRDRVKAGMN